MPGVPLPVMHIGASGVEKVTSHILLKPAKAFDRLPLS